MLKSTTAKYAISLDDDSQFLSDQVLENIEKYFSKHKKCGLIACRIFWGKQEPPLTVTLDRPTRVQGFVGCGHVWNMKAWRDIPDYPEWFKFYGEEEFASYQLFKKDWQVHYVPSILVQHRVEVKSRKSQKDYGIRLRRSLRAGWYNYILFLPWNEVPKRFLYTLYIQIKLKVFRGDIKAAKAVIQAMWDLLVHLPLLLIRSNRLSGDEFIQFQGIAKTKIYWKQDDKANT